MFIIRGAQASARCVVATPRNRCAISRKTPALVVHTFRYGLLVRLASRSLDHRVWQTTSLAGH
jgi:hypothetical protein